MRILVLVVATFAAGLLAGTLFPSDGSSRHSASRPSQDGGTERGTRPAPREAGDTGRDRPAPSADADVAGLADEARREIERLVRSDRAVAVMSGDGRITGTVRDPAGAPIAGVIVSARHDAQPFRLAMVSRRMRQRPHEDRDLGAVARDAIEGELWRRHVRRSATTGADGKFALTDLMDARHTVSAFHEDYDIRPSGQNRPVPDAVVDFVARPVVKVKTEVRMPDGELAEHAWISWKGEHGTGWDAWIKDDGFVRLPVGACTVEAQTSVPTPLHSPAVERNVAAQPSDEVLVLQLEGRRVLTARLRLPEGFVTPQAVQYHLRSIREGQKIDPAKLIKGHSPFRTANASPGRASWNDVPPGHYFVAALLNKRRLIAQAVTEVASGPVDVELAVEAPDDARVKLVGPDGGPVPGPASFHVFAGPEGRARYQPVDGLQGGDGVWALWLDRIDAGPHGTKGTLRVGTRDYGSAMQPIRLPSAGAFTLRLGKPAKLNVTVKGFHVKTGATLYAALRGEETAVAWSRIEPDGTCNVDGVQPGAYDLLLVLSRQGQTWVILRDRVRLAAGELERSVAMPALHTLKVRVPDGFRGRGLRLRCKDAALGEFKRDAGLRGRLVTFDNLAAGSYELEAGKKRMAVRVPGPAEVLFE